MDRNRISEHRNAVKGVQAAKARAVCELDKAEVATHEALDELKQTTRELTEKIEEARAHIGVSAEDDEAAPISTDPAKLRLPLAASLPA